MATTFVLGAEIQSPTGLYAVILYCMQSLPFVEYELHKQLVNKLKIKGMNSLFRLKIQISVGVTQLVAVAVSYHFAVLSSSK